MNKGGKVVVVGGVVGGLALLIWAATRTEAAPSKPGPQPGITHPEFAVGDEINEINALPVDPYYDMVVTAYTAGVAPNYGSYVLKIMTGPQAGYTTTWWVADIDGYYQKVT